MPWNHTERNNTHLYTQTWSIRQNGNIVDHADAEPGHYLIAKAHATIFVVGESQRVRVLVDDETRPDITPLFIACVREWPNQGPNPVVAATQRMAERMAAHLAHAWAIMHFIRRGETERLSDAGQD